MPATWIHSPSPFPNTNWLIRMMLPNTGTANRPEFCNIGAAFALELHPRCLLLHKQTKDRSPSQGVYHPATQDSSTAINNPYLPVTNEEPGRQIKLLLHNQLPLSRLLQRQHCLHRGCCNPGAPQGSHRDTWQPCTASEVSVNRKGCVPLPKCL